MKRLAFFTLEGLLQQGRNQVWITLGRFNTADEARNATQDPTILRAGISETRVMPMFRDSGVSTTPAFHRPVRPAVAVPHPGSIEDSFTVA